MPAMLLPVGKWGQSGFFVEHPTRSTAPTEKLHSDPISLGPPNLMRRRIKRGFGVKQVTEFT